MKLREYSIEPIREFSKINSVIRCEGVHSFELSLHSTS